MKKKIITKILWGFAGIVIILILTNPSNTAYTEYLKSNGFKTETYYPESHPGGAGRVDAPEISYKPYWGKRINYLIFTTFKYNDGCSANYFRNHTGILSNFYETRPSIKK